MVQSPPTAFGTFAFQAVLVVPVPASTTGGLSSAVTVCDVHPLPLTLTVIDPVLVVVP
jgi:hypothetical protein